MSLIWVPDPVRDRLAEVAAVLKEKRGGPVEFYEVVEYLLAAGD